jgi:hypothetical protein
MSVTVGWDGAVVPDEDDDFDVPVDMLAYANAVRGFHVKNFVNKAARNTAAAALPAGHRAVCWVDGNVGLCAYDGSGWVNLSPYKRYSFDHSYGSGAVATPGGSYTDPSGLALPDLVNSQEIEVDIQASVRIDGSTRQSIDIKAVADNGTLQSTQALTPIIYQQDESGSDNEYITYTRKMMFYANTGDTTLQLQIVCGAGADRLVMSQAQMWAKVYPIDAA